MLSDVTGDPAYRNYALREYFATTDTQLYGGGALLLAAAELLRWRR